MVARFYRSTREAPERPADPAVRRANLRRIGPLFAPYKARLSGLLLLIVVSAGLGVVPAFLLKRVLEAIGRMCGWTLARAHARSGDPAAIAGYLGSGDVFDRAIAEFAEAYADQNERDYGALLDAIDAGRVAAEFA